MNQARAWAGMSRIARPTRRTEHGPSWSTEPLCGLRITDRLELVARLLQGPRRLYARRTLLAACGLDQARRNHARRAIFGPLRGRLRPSEIETPRLPQWPYHGPPEAATAVVLP